MLPQYQFNITQGFTNKVAERDARLSLRYEAGLDPYDYAGYVDNVTKQREHYPKYPKIDLDIPLDFTYDKTVTRLLVEAISSFGYVGIRKVPSYIYKEEITIESLLAYELISKQDVDYKDFKYLYIPVHRGASLDLPEVSSLRPTQNYLYISTASDYPVNKVMITKDLEHPFLPGFFLTGHLVILTDGSALYEYFDEQGDYGLKDRLYLSPLMPPDLRFPLGMPTSNQIEKFGIAASTYTGYRTNINYSPTTYYLYDSSSGCRLSTAVPV